MKKPSDFKAALIGAMWGAGVALTFYAGGYLSTILMG